MLAGSIIANALADAGFTEIVWIPDSYLGTWESGLRAEPRLKVICVAREGEALGVAAGLMIGRRRPLVVMQCTGLFEAGDALRNVVHDLGLPLKLAVGIRSGVAAQSGPVLDTCPRYVRPFLSMWEVPTLDWSDQTEIEFRRAITALVQIEGAAALLIPE